jgi:hypothetical protein
MHWQQLATVAAGDRDRARMEKKAVADELDKLEREHEVMKSYTEKLKKESEAAAKKVERLEKEKSDFESKTNRIKKSESLAKSKLAQVHLGVRIGPQPSLSDAIDWVLLMALNLEGLQRISWTVLAGAERKRRFNEGIDGCKKEPRVRAAYQYDQACGRRQGMFLLGRKRYSDDMSVCMF